MNNDDAQSRRPICRLLALRVSAEDHESFKQEAESYGYDISTLLRLRIYGKVKGMKITRRPSADMMMLGDIIGRLGAMTSELNKLGSNVNQIAKRLNQGSRDVFGLDGAMRLLERLGKETLRILNMIETAIMGRKNAQPAKENDHDTHA